MPSSSLLTGQYYTMSIIVSTGVALAPPLWGGAVGVRGFQEKEIVSHMYKYAVFNMNPTYNH